MHISSACPPGGVYEGCSINLGCMFNLSGVLRILTAWQNSITLSPMSSHSLTQQAAVRNLRPRKSRRKWFVHFLLFSHFSQVWVELGIFFILPGSNREGVFKLVLFCSYAPFWTRVFLFAQTYSSSRCAIKMVRRGLRRGCKAEDIVDVEEKISSDGGNKRNRSEDGTLQRGQKKRSRASVADRHAQLDEDVSPRV